MSPPDDQSAIQRMVVAAWNMPFVYRSGRPGMSMGSTRLGRHAINSVSLIDKLSGFQCHCRWRSTSSVAKATVSLPASSRSNPNDNNESLWVVIFS